jgi:hypothetical protein
MDLKGHDSCFLCNDTQELFTMAMRFGDCDVFLQTDSDGSI